MCVCVVYACVHIHTHTCTWYSTDDPQNNPPYKFWMHTFKKINSINNES